MDWTKAKTILIVSFLLLNIFLGWQIWANKGDVKVMEESLGTAGRIDDFLQKNGITLLSEIPTDTPEMNYLHVRYGVNRFSQQVSREGQVINIEKESVIKSKLTEPIRVEDPYNQNNWPDSLQEKVKYYNNYVYDPHQKETVTFIQTYNKLPLFNSTLKLEWKNSMARGYEQNYFEVVNRGSGRKVVSASAALRSMVEDGVIQQGEKIEMIQLGYYSPTYDAEIQVLSPVWRIVHDGQIHYVNGITGVVEKLPSLEKTETLPDNN